jgi:probable phosphoglycerate mutase
VRFPGGETLGEAQRRVVAVLEELAGRHPRGAVALVTHGDVIKLAVAHYAGVHIDLYQRIEAGPGSISAVALRDGAPLVLRVNDTGTLEDLVPRTGSR